MSGGNQRKVKICDLTYLKFTRYFGKVTILCRKNVVKVEKKEKMTMMELRKKKEEELTQVKKRKNQRRRKLWENKKSPKPVAEEASIKFFF